MKKYCYKCEKEVDTKVITKKEIYDVCGENIEVYADVLVCVDCGEELYCEELDSVTLKLAYDEYRRRHNLLFPDEIKRIRQKYGLSQRSFAKLLHWGDKTIFRYENGSIQDSVHNALLLFLKEPRNMRAYLAENKVELSERKKSELLKIIDNLEEKMEHNLIWDYFDDSIFVKKLSEENGYRTFNYEKVCAMVLFFAQKIKGLLKTKLMKLLNYADMIFFKENGISISGIRYVHFPYGPVPENFDFLLGMMAIDHIAHIDVAYENEYEKHYVIPERDVPLDILSKDELLVMERIYKKFANFSSRDISNYSHKEKGYISTQQGEFISYRYAKDIEF